ncbi:YeiH family protein [Paraburkholderia guartelaensis]|uniref:YeiH family protein n=1 Tax=Paraburkholderia guartelaensis TaxID=2546446 RepID=UPI002AB5E561|nr:putative sulfate exporter family transporter [Paraburkholderia guartelaensis]
MSSLSPNRPTPRSRNPFHAGYLAGLIPGVALCIGVCLVSWLLQALQARLFGHVWLESLVLAILVGALVRIVWTPGGRWTSGITFSAKTLLEISVVLLGVSFSAAALQATGVKLLAGIVVIVIAAILASYGIGRVLKLPRRMALLIACGNSICGNSAIAAVAPVIGASRDDVAASIAFTAVLGVAVVLGLPLLSLTLHLNAVQYGTLAGMTVYAVPQVLAATAPVSTVSVHIGTLVKLVRVLMLGPVMLLLSTLVPGRDPTAGTPEQSDGSTPQPGKVRMTKLVPWFIVGFVLLCTARAAGLIPMPLLQPASQFGSVLTVVSMAALGLGTDLRTVAKAGPRVTSAVVLSILALAMMSLVLIHVLRIA